MNLIDVVVVMDFAGALLCLVAVLLTLRFREIAAAKPLGLLFVLLCCWMLSEALILSVNDPSFKFGVLKFRFLVGTFVSLVWVAVARAVTAARKANWWQLPCLVLLVFMGFCFTNDLHHLFFERVFVLANQRFPVMKYTSLFFVYAAFSYGLILYGGWLIWRALRSTSGVWHFELRLWLLCVITPTIIDVASFIPGLEVLDIFTPLALALSTSVASWGLVRQRIFQVQPVALEAAFQSMRDGVIIVDNAWRVARVNKSVTLEPGRFVGQHISLLLAGWQNDLANQSFEVKVNDSVLEYTTSTIASGGFVVLIRDLTELRRYEHQLLEAAMRDPLTHLLNRRAFLEQAQMILARSQTTCLVYLDLDGFKRINDRLGHESGDELLIEVTRKLADFLKNHLLARVGGDEFVILFELPKSVVETLMLQLELLIAEPLSIKEQSVMVGLSWGLAVFPEDGQQLETLLRIADERMFAAKNQRSERRR